MKLGGRGESKKENETKNSMLRPRRRWLKGQMNSQQASRFESSHEGYPEQKQMALVGPSSSGLGIARIGCLKLLSTIQATQKPKSPRHVRPPIPGNRSHTVHWCAMRGGMLGSGTRELSRVPEMLFILVRMVSPRWRNMQHSREQETFGLFTFLHLPRERR